MAISVCAAALSVAPAALADTGGIAGTVTDASTTTPLAGIEVDVFASGGGFAAQVCTGSGGTYSAPGLTSGSYTVAFAPHNGFCGVLRNYQPQYYSGATSAGTATPVTVMGGTTTSGIGAALHPGGIMTGTVTDASSSSPIAGVEVDVYDSSHAYVEELCTGSGGTYSAPGLASGNYTVEFQTTGVSCDSLNYVTQYYGGQASAGSATPVGVTAGATTSGIGAALQPGGIITGSVTDASSSGALPGVEVDVYDSSHTFAKEVCTGSGGRTRSRVCRPGRTTSGS